MKSQEEQWLLAEKYNGEKTEGFFTDCKALALGEPLAYLIGHTPFLDCTIHLDGRPLVPRVETEFWVEKAIAAIQESLSNQTSLFSTPQNNVHTLDLCAGSGCIGTAVAKAVREATVDFAEIDRRLLPTIQKNIDANIANSKRCTVFHSNLFEALPNDTKYSFILTNPPYIDPTLNRVDESVKDFEPHLALFGGIDGMEIIADLIKQAPHHLLPSGQLWIEHEPEQTVAISEIAAECNFSVTSHSDQYDVVRYSVLVLE